MSFPYTPPLGIVRRPCLKFLNADRDSGVACIVKGYWEEKARQILTAPHDVTLVMVLVASIMIQTQ